MSDVCARRHRGSAESVNANAAIGPHKGELRERILARLRFPGPATVKEISSDLNIHYTTVSARLSELKADRLIEKTGERREGCAVVRVSLVQGRLF